MSRHPRILARDWEIRAALAGRKTVWRRPMRKQPPPECSINYPLGNESWRPEGARSLLRHLWEAWHGPLFKNRPSGHLCGHFVQLAPYRPSDVLSVREAWHPRSPVSCPCCVAYRADHSISETCCDHSMDYTSAPWRSSATMPAWASRLSLPVVNVRAERLHDVSEDDAAVEGLLELPELAFSTLTAMIEQWNEDNPRHPWDSNPWTWRVEVESPLAVSHLAR